jgi:hypothetical protein
MESTIESIMAMLNQVEDLIFEVDSNDNNIAAKRMQYFYIAKMNNNYWLIQLVKKT